MKFLRNTIHRIRLATNYLVAGDATRCLDTLIRESDESVLTRAESILLRAITLGKRGRFRITPEFISISATENCNLKCIMCPGHAGMTGPKLSVEDADMLFGSLDDKDVHFGRPKFLDMTAGEPTINPSLGPIFSRFKAFFPDAKISIISNATIPVRGRIREAFAHANRIGLSMDGATKETYERIRKGSIYENVVRNVRDIAELKKHDVNCENLEIMFVAMDQNIHELPEMVRLAHSLGVPGLFAQASEVRARTPFNGEGQNISLSLSKEKLAPFIREAKAEAKRLGIKLSLTSQLSELLETRQQPNSTPSVAHGAKPPIGLEVAIRTCSIPWTHAPRISQNNDGIFPTTVCCHMPQMFLKGSLRGKTEFRGMSINEIFNSEYYWDIRSGLLNGTLAKDSCEGCQYHQMTQWSGPQLLALETAIEAVERLI